MLGIAGSNVSYRDRVFEFIDSFSNIFDEIVLETAKGIFTDLPPANTAPSTTGLSLIYLSDRINGGSIFTANFSEIITSVIQRDDRIRKPQLGRKLLRNVKKKADEYEKITDVNRILQLNEVIYSGSKIGYEELLREA